MSIKYFCSCLFFTVLLSLVPSYGDTNLLTNPGFEEGTSGWYDRGCSIDTVSSPVHSGALSGKAFNRASAWQGIRQPMKDKMSAGNTYRVSGWVRLESAASDTVTVSFEQRDDGGTRYINVASNDVTDSNWVQLSGDFMLDVNGTLEDIYVYFEGPAAGVNFFVDDASIYCLTPATEAPIDPNKSGKEIEGFEACGAPQENRQYDILFAQSSLDIYGIRNTYDMEPQTITDSEAIIKQGEAIPGRD